MRCIHLRDKPANDLTSCNTTAWRTINYRINMSQNLPRAETKGKVLFSQHIQYQHREI